MGQVTVTLNGRTYRLRCEEGEERRLMQLATYVSEQVDRLAVEFGQIGDDRLLLMAALLISDELFDVRERVAALEQGRTEETPPHARHPSMAGTG